MKIVAVQHDENFVTWAPLKVPFLKFFKEIKILNILMKTFLGSMPLLSALFYASKQLITQVPPIM